MRQVEVSVHSVERFASLIGDAPVRDVLEAAAALRARLAGNVIWHVNSTERGGGVAELLHSNIGYARSTGLDARWLVVSGPPEFFELTKRIHHGLHGSAGDARLLDEAAAGLYARVLHQNLLDVAELIQPGDVVILHDPQTAGLARDLRQLGARIIWRCHVGSDEPNDEVCLTWAFLEPFLRDVELFVFSRRDYVPPFIDPDRAVIITPTIDPFSSKNQDLPEENVRAILVHTGLIEGPRGPGAPVYTRDDGTLGRVDRAVDGVRLGRAPRFDTPIVTQVSRWDWLKDPIGVLTGFARMLDAEPAQRANLILAGPNVKAVADDPEGASVFEKVLEAWRALPHHHRAKIDLVNLPMADLQENAAIVNALQRHSAVIIQKSLHEGFGLTVAEAMWKSRPVIASAVGGIQDQIVDGESGLLLKDPSDLTTFSGTLQSVLDRPDFAARLGRNARHRVQSRFLGLHSLALWDRLVLDLLESSEAAAPREAGYTSMTTP